MGNRRGSILGGLAAAMLWTGCDPYAGENTGPPSVIGVFATDGDPFGPSFVDGTGSGAAWSVTIPSTCTPDPLVAATGAVTADLPVIFVKVNKLLDGQSIEAPPQGPPPQQICLPAGSPPWLTATPVPVGESWRSCYSPGSPTVAEGSSVVLFKAAAYDGAVPWSAVASLEGAALGDTTYTLGGTVRDKQGQPLGFAVTAVAAGKAVGATPGLTAALAPGEVALAWGNGACGGTPTYTVERTAGLAPTAGCPTDPGSFAPIASGLVARVHTDGGLASATLYCYRVFVTVNGVDGPPSPAVGATTP